jgi:hypothetical protein
MSFQNVQLQIQLVPLRPGLSAKSHKEQVEDIKKQLTQAKKAKKLNGGVSVQAGLSREKSRALELDKKKKRKSIALLELQLERTMTRALTNLVGDCTI